MNKLNNEKKISLLKIQKARLILDADLRNGLITEKDIIGLLKVDSDYGLTKQGKLSYKESALKQIYNCPFLLCDQVHLSCRVISILPIFLNIRYDMELDELDELLETEQISFDEYMDAKEMLKFCYYESSAEGKEIKDNRHSRSVRSKKKIK